MGRKDDLEAEAAELQKKLRDHDTKKPEKNDPNRSYWEIGRKAISDRLTQVGRELR